jgi:toxin ParE1/3/4
MHYRTTRRADRDLIDLYVYGNLQFGTDQAERYHRGLIRTFELLADNPRIARERTESLPPVRIYPYEGGSISAAHASPYRSVKLR